MWLFESKQLFSGKEETKLLFLFAVHHIIDFNRTNSKALLDIESFFYAV